MKVLIVGSGGREHALAWKIRQSPRVDTLFCAPGNAGTATLGTNLPIPAEDVEGLANFATREDIDLTVVGPEAPLVAGIVDVFRQRGLRIFGPTRQAAEIEGSKIYAKSLMQRFHIPTAQSALFSTPEEARAFLPRCTYPVVVKADGLAAGKGAIICRNEGEATEAIEQMMVKRIFGKAGERILIEEFLPGEEASVFALTDGTHLLPLPSAQDHKAVYDQDRGPNTGGMGAYSPAPLVERTGPEKIRQQILEPAVAALAQEGRPYTGVLYAGLMIQQQEPKVLEFNARFGDPEAQVLLVRLEDDLIPALEATIDGTLDQIRLRWRKEAAVCVVMASQGYPGPYEKGKEIQGLEAVAEMEDVVVFHAGTALREGKVVTSGGRVLGVTALGETIAAAIERAYTAVKQIWWEGVHYRTDIGQKALRG
ncbi:MAG: phosphoribosylamine--glycine ligase [Nitrospinota bacterium]|nr:MAG: phosphoribosylamine--glycine ligase [Nitrospinota bacterium]